MKFKDLVEGKEYRNINDKPIYIIEDGLLFSVITDRYSIKSAREISCIEFEEIPWKPNYAVNYYFVYSIYDRGYQMRTNADSNLDKNIISRIKVYRTEEEVVQAVKELGWNIE